MITPFGLFVSNEPHGLYGLKGVVCVANDIGVTGVSEADHDTNLENLLQRCTKMEIKLNNSPTKLQILHRYNALTW
jgi:hypothetical protein